MTGGPRHAPRAAPRRRIAALRENRRGTVMVEFAICGPIFFLLLFVVFEVAYDLYLQEVLDSALQTTARQIQTGGAQPTTAAALISNNLCPNALNLLNCNNLFVRVERISDTQCEGGYGAADLYDATNGRLPGTGGQLELGLFGGLTGTGTGGISGPVQCETNSSAGGFCVAGPSAGLPEIIIMNAVYVAPSFLGRLVQNTISYNGKIVRATQSTTSFITEGFTQQTLPQGVTAC